MLLTNLKTTTTAITKMLLDYLYMRRGEERRSEERRGEERREE